MQRKIKIILLILAMAGVIFWINGRISNYDLRFYAGKDDGLFARFESIFIFSLIFYLVLGKGNFFVLFAMGICAGIILSITSFIICRMLFHTGDLAIQIVACLLVVFSFFLLDGFAKKQFNF